MRGFGAEIHYVRTRDGYFLHVVRIINPLIHRRALKKPIIFNHGLLESSTIWLINSHGVTPTDDAGNCGYVPIDALNHNGTYFLNGPMMLANNGYDVWLMSMRGTDWSLLHEKLKPEDKEFWNYCLDDFALVDVPTVVDYVRRETGRPTVGYVGHSQATFSIFALLAARPSYADVIEPVVAVAPVAYFDHITSISRLLFIGTLTATTKDMHGPFPPDAKKIRKLAENVCTSGFKLNEFTCKLINILISGVGARHMRKGFYSHVPFYTSLKVLRQFGQMIRHKRFMMFDYGETENQRLYNQTSSPSYPIENIRSKSLSLISTQSDSLSPPRDVEHFKKELKVPLYRDIFIEGQFNHFDLMLNPDAKKLVFPQVLEIFESFEKKSCTFPNEIEGEDAEASATFVNEFDGQLGGTFETNQLRPDIEPQNNFGEVSEATEENVALNLEENNKVA